MHTALSSTVYHSLASSVNDLAMEHTGLEPEPKPKPRSEPELLVFISTTPPPSYFEDDFTMYLDKLLLAVLEDEKQQQQHAQNQHENRTRRYSYSTFSATQSPNIINAGTEMPDQICYGSQSQTPSASDSDGIAEWKTSWTPTDEIVCATKINLDFNLDAHSGSGFCSCSCSECTSSWTSRTPSIISGSAQGQAPFLSEPGISTSSSSDSTTSSSSTSTACTPNKVLGSDRIGRSRTCSISSASASDSRVESQDHQGRTSISPRGVTSMIYGYNEERYTSDDDECDEGSLDTRSRSVSSARLYSEVSSQDTTTSHPTPTQSKPKHKRRLSLGQEEYENKDKDELQPEDSGAIQDSPPFKKQKLEPTRILKSVHPKFAATQPASLRRGLSLRSVDDENAYTPNPIKAESTPLLTITNRINNTCPPTVPTTPIPSPQSKSKSKSNSKPHIFSRNAAHTAHYYLPPSDSPIPSSELKFKVPIIAPPPFHLIPKKPLSMEDAAEGRLRVLLEREREMRVGDGLGVGDFGEWGGGRVDDTVDELERKLLVADVGSLEHARRFTATVDGSLNHTRHLNLGIQDIFRREIIEWILDCSHSILPSYLM
ncbi:hypothetical protein PILCRDRAFT_269967 [Piloderma croceum F 1598]|uniref:Uncharacterized protein n=1 Tax=Piloderma croceum (strain F 1598) TaxID=765440 RepID=A0A0C3G8K2_PILCF|nr:hypothetical protein PILCRDRAFT_269967 [Piloderma croceum F 1598]